MNLIDEQQLPRLQIHQQTDDVAGALQGGGAGDAAVHPQLFGQHHGHGGFAQTRRSVEQHMIQGIAAAKGRLHSNAEHLLELALTDVIVETARPEAVIATGRRRWIQIVSGLPGGIHHPVGRPFRPGAWSCGVGRNDRHVGRVPSPG